MGRLLSQYKNPTWEELCQLAQIADEVYRSELKSRGPRRDRTRRRDDVKVNHVGRDHDGTHHEEEWSDQAQDARVEYCEMWCRHMGEDNKDLDYLVQVLTPAQTTEQPFDSMTDKRMVFCMEDAPNATLCCPWFTTRASGCHPRQGKVCCMAHNHKERNPTYCICEKGRTCPYGGKCGYRHQDDVYTVWVLRKKNGILMAVRIELKDYRNKWSKHYKAPKKGIPSSGPHKSRN